MAYTKTNWQDLPNTTTPVNASNLNNIETGVENNDKRLNGTSVAGSMIVDGIRTKNMLNTLTLVQASTGGAGTDIEGTTSATITARTKDSISFTTTSNWQGVASFYIEVKPSTQYTLSFQNSAGASQSYSKIVCYNNSKTMLQDFSQSGNLTHTITTPANTKYIRVIIEKITSSSTATTLSNIQFEEGSSATTYKTYEEIDINDSGWIDMTFTSNDWQARGSGVYHPKFRVIGNVVYLQGQFATKQTLNAGIHTITISNIPTPKNQYSFSTVAFGGQVFNCYLVGNVLSIKTFTANYSDSIGVQIDGSYPLN